MQIEEFTIPFSQASVDDLRDRLERMRWPDEVPDAAWMYGCDRELYVLSLERFAEVLGKFPDGLEETDDGLGALS